VIELKTTKFKPEFTGKLNFYITAIDREVKDKNDNPTIGILICKSKNDTVVEYTLSNVNNPMGVSEYTLSKELSKLKELLPSIEEIEKEVKKIEVENESN
jgi:DNA-binding protein YbaB